MSDKTILVTNTGSSSIKMALIDKESEQCIAEGIAQRLGERDAVLSWTISETEHSYDLENADSHAAMRNMLNALFSLIDKDSIVAVGHRVVHGGEKFSKPIVIDDEVIADIEFLSHLAPLHNPVNLIGIREAMKRLQGVPHVAVFDTAFHHTLPPHAYLYAVPYHWYKEYGVRRYGFHGTSHHYVAQEAARLLGRRFNACRLVTLHLGNGCSATAIKDGISIDTTMGMTPLEGLVMGTRSGDVDPGLHQFIAKKSGASLEKVTDMLNRESGLLGLSGLGNDMRTLLHAAEAGESRAVLAIEVFCYRLAKSIATLTVSLERIDAIVFTGGIGEHASAIRAKVSEQLAIFGVALDVNRNNQHGRDTHGFISMDGADISLLVVATAEEKMIARYVAATLFDGERRI
ncbi:MAG: acetate kinase [Mariprofundaceae bacterium]|nr:acetate kinase [Mariprofundaceae bacterium]